MSNVVDGPPPYRVPVNEPFERSPQCGCDTGTGPTFREQAARIAELEAAVRVVVDTFTKAEAQGYRSRDRQFAIDILSRAINGTSKPTV